MPNGKLTNRLIVSPIPGDWKVGKLLIGPRGNSTNRRFEGTCLMGIKDRFLEMLRSIHSERREGLSQFVHSERKKAFIIRFFLSIWREWKVSANLSEGRDGTVFILSVRRESQLTQSERTEGFLETYHSGLSQTCPIGRKEHFFIIVSTLSEWTE